MTWESNIEISFHLSQVKIHFNLIEKRYFKTGFILTVYDQFPKVFHKLKESASY